MCDPVSAGVTAAVVAPMLMQKPQMPAAPAAPTAPPASQAARQPDQQALRGAAAGAGAAGSGSSTMLTGPGGVAPNLLSIGKNTLLGA